MYSSQIRGTGSKGENEPVAAYRAWLRGNVLLTRAPQVTVAELEWHTLSHKVEALDSYRLFTLADGNTYQLTNQGKFLEKVKNLGEKESEVRERIAKVVIAGNSGINLIVDESKIPREIALCTALCFWVDQWNTNLALRGIYWG